MHWMGCQVQGVMLCYILTIGDSVSAHAQCLIRMLTHPVAANKLYRATLMQHNVCTAGGWHAAEVADNKDGTYFVSFKPEKAGSFQLVLSMEGLPKASAHKRTYTGTCIADMAAAEKCSISGVMTQLVAGQPGKLTLTRADR